MCDMCKYIMSNNDELCVFCKGKLNIPPTDSDWEEKFIEQGADIEHERWSHWQKYMHSKILPSANDEIMEIGTVLIERWNRQINTPYSELSESEKESDRKEVRKYLPLIRHLIQSERESQKQEWIKKIEKIDTSGGGNGRRVLAHILEMIKE